jgi:hypothetical protein
MVYKPIIVNIARLFPNGSEITPKRSIQTTQFVSGSVVLSLPGGARQSPKSVLSDLNREQRLYLQSMQGKRGEGLDFGQKVLVI